MKAMSARNLGLVQIRECSEARPCIGKRLRALFDGIFGATERTAFRTEVMPALLEASEFGFGRLGRCG